MDLTPEQKKLLRHLPGVDRILELAAGTPGFGEMPAALLVNTIRKVIGDQRARILSGSSEAADGRLSETQILALVGERLRHILKPRLVPLINATGIVIHTNLGRSLLAAEAVENVAAAAGSYTNLEYDLSAGRRGSRYSHVEEIICEITGAEAALVVNNNAGAVLLCLEAIARGRKVVVSRGELVEIGGSFRVPDVMAKSGAILAEVGTTNRTHPRDYENAVDADTALLLKVHRSNFSVVGFTTEVTLKELVLIGGRHGIPVMEDLGSGTFVDFSEYGLAKEPTVQESVASGADVVSFSGDKLLGGPQAGIIVGKSPLIEKIKKNPITRALRIDKLTLAALEATLRLYRDEKVAVATIPTLRMLTTPNEEVAARARQLMDGLHALADPRLSLSLVGLSSKAGGGALPLLEVPSTGVRIRMEGVSVNRIERELRRRTPPIIGRIEEDGFLIDPRTLRDDELPAIVDAFAAILRESTDE